MEQGGAGVGDCVGAALVGDRVVGAVGARVGDTVVGALVGDLVGVFVVGALVTASLNPS